MLLLATLAVLRLAFELRLGRDGLHIGFVFLGWSLLRLLLDLLTVLWEVLFVFAVEECEVVGVFLLAIFSGSFLQFLVERL